MIFPPDPSPRPAAPSEAPGAPFELPGGPDAVLLLHGLTGTPFELRPVAEALHARGLRCRAPLLPGHGGTPRDLAGVPWTAWVEGARRELLALAGARRTYLVGCSMGALVACALAHELPDRVAGLALLAPALRLAAPGRLAGWLSRTPARRLVVPKTGGSDVQDREARRANPCLDGIPLAAVGELQRLARRVDALLPAVTAPALVVLGARDHTVSNAGGRRLAARLGGQPARVLELPRSAHLVGIDLERARCAAEVADFFANIGGASPAAAAAGQAGEG